ncbi:Titin [Nymphon striatum]|nr:Titin [Nymphon striatum]
MEVNEGKMIRLDCKISGRPLPEVSWYCNGQLVTDDRTHKLIVNEAGNQFRPAYEFDYVALDILSVYAEDSGVYTCKATNRLGEAVTSATVKCIGHQQSWGSCVLNTTESQRTPGCHQRQTLTNQKYSQPKYLIKCSTNPSSSQRLIFSEKMLFEPHSDVNVSTSNLFFKQAYIRLFTKDSQTFSATKSLIFDSQLPPEMANGQEKIMAMEDAMHRPRRQQSQDVEKQAPVFVVPLENLNDLREGENAHFEARLTPTDDPDLQLIAEFKLSGKRSVILDSQLPEGMDTIEKIARIEGYSSERVTEDWMDTDDTHAPQFLSQPQDLILMEDSLAHFDEKINCYGATITKRMENWHTESPKT